MMANYKKSVLWPIIKAMTWRDYLIMIGASFLYGMGTAMGRSMW